MRMQTNPYQATQNMTVVKSVQRDADITIINKNNSFSTCKSCKVNSTDYNDPNKSVAQTVSNLLRQQDKIEQKK